MCKLNPARSSAFLVEFYTADKKMPNERWIELVYEKILEIERDLNKTGEIRVHVSEIQLSSNLDSSNPTQSDSTQQT